MLAVAMIVSSLTYYHSYSTDVKAAQSDAASYDWSGVGFLGNGTGHSENTDKYKWANVSGTGVANVQNPGNIADSIYFTVPSADIGTLQLNGSPLTVDEDYHTQGTGIFLHVSCITEAFNDLVINYSNNNQMAEAYIYCKGGTGDVTVTSTQTSTEAFVEGQELLTNTAFAMSEGSVTGWNVDNLTRHSSNENGTLVAIVPQIGASETQYSKQIVQNNISLKTGVYYRATATVGCDIARKVAMMIQSDGNNGGNWAEIIKPTSTTEAGGAVTFDRVFTVATDGKYLFDILLGAVDGTAAEQADIQLYNVSLKQYSTEQLANAATAPTEVAYAGYAHPISAPANLSDGSSTEEHPHRITWSAVSNATGYYVYVGETLVGTVTEGTQYDIPNSNFDEFGDYQVSVKAYNDYAESTSSTITHIHKVWSLAAPTGLSVTGNSTDGYTLTWGAVANAASYKVFLDSDETGISVNSASHTFNAATLAQGTAHTFKVQAINGTVSSELSAVLNYTVPVESLDTPQNVTSTGLAEDLYTFTWSAVTNATSYDVYINDALTPVAADVATTTCSIAAVNFPANGRFTVKVVAKNGAVESQPGTYSFTTIPNLAITLTQDKMNNTQTLSNSISSSWTNPAGTNRVMIYLKDAQGNLYPAQARSGTVWNNNANYSDPNANQIMGDQNRAHMTIADGGTFTVVVRAYSSTSTTDDTTILAEGEASITVDEFTNTNLAAQYDRYVQDGEVVVISHFYVKDAVEYRIFNVATGERLNSADYGYYHNVTVPTTEVPGTKFSLIVKAYDSNGDEITTTNGTVNDLNCYYIGGDVVEPQPDENKMDFDDLTGTYTIVPNYSDSYNPVNIYMTNYSNHNTWFKLYRDWDHTTITNADIAYHNDRTNCKINGEAIVFAGANKKVTSIWVNGVRYPNDGIYFNQQGDCYEFATSIFERENVVTIYYQDTSTVTFGMIKDIHEPDIHRDAEQDDIDPEEIDDWQLLANTSSTGSKAYISQSVYTNDMGVNQTRGYLAKNGGGYNRSANMNAKDVFTFSTKTGGDAAITSIIVDGIEYYNVKDAINELVYVGGGDCVYIDDSLVDAAPETTEYHTITVEGNNTLQTFIVKVVGPEIKLSTPVINSITHNSFLDGTQNYLDISFTDSNPLEGTVYNLYVNYPMDTALASEPILVGQITSTNTTILTSALNKANNQYIQEGQVYNFYLEAVNGTHTSEMSTAYDYTHEDNVVENTFSNAGTKFPATNTNGNNYIYYDLITASASLERMSAVQAIDNPQGYSNPSNNPAGTRWGTNGDDGDPQYIVVDMYCEYHIKEIDIAWEAASARDYEVLVSEDGENYTKVAHIVGARTDIIVETASWGNRCDKIVLPSQVEARYVKINGLKRCTNYGYSIWDIGVYGPDSNGIVPDAHRYYNQEQIDLSSIAAWQEVTGRSSVNTATAYVSKVLYDDNTMFGDHALLGYYGPGATPDWNHINDEMNAKSVFGFVVKNASKDLSTTLISSVVIDGEEYFNVQDKDDEMVYVGADCVYIDESLLDAGPGETNYHLVTIVCDDENVKLETFVVKTVGSDVFSISKNATYEDEYNRNGIEFPDTKVIGGSTMNNYLRYSNVTATTTDDARQGAQYAIDNFAGTRWESKWGDDYSPAESIVIDLGAPYLMKELDISWERANAKNFTIEYSTDGINYTEATTVKNAKASEIVDGIVNSDRVDYIVFPTAYEARYIRLTGQYRNLTEVGKYGYSIWEMAVYGPSDSAFLELNNDNGLVLATWPKQAAADSYKLSYTSGGVAKVITIADPNTTSQYFNDDTGYPDNGTEVVLNSYNDGVVIGEPFSVTALADLYVDEVTLNNGETLLINEEGDVVLTIKNKGTAWINTNVADFVAEASATNWTPAKSTAGGKANLKPDMTDSTSITFEDFSQSSVGIYTIQYAINTKTDGAEVNPEHLIKESYYGNNAGSTDVEVKSTASYKKNDGVSVEGFQIRTNREPDPEFDGTVAFRTVCKAPNIGSTITVGGEQCTVTGFGTIYVIDDNTTGVHALNRLNSTFTYLNAENIIDNEQYKYTGAKTYNGVNKTYGYVATEKAVLSGYEKNGYTYYATTMQGMDALMANSLIVRAFVLTDKGIVYGTASARTSVAEIAYYLHRDSMTDNNGGHDYLYDAILHSDYVVESQYHLDSPFEYGWNKILYETKPN